MHSFLIVGSLSVGFNLFLLAGLHRETRRRRSRTAVSRHTTSFLNNGTIHLLGSTLNSTADRSNNRFRGDEPAAWKSDPPTN
jgi:hypothetical protein